MIFALNIDLPGHQLVQLEDGFECLPEAVIQYFTHWYSICRSSKKGITKFTKDRPFSHEHNTQNKRQVHSGKLFPSM